VSFAFARYAEARAETTSPAQLVVALYDAALRSLRGAQISIAERDYAKKGAQLSRAHEIVTELRVTLDETRAPALCAELTRLYDYVRQQITEANLHADAAPLAGAILVLERLRGAWATVAGTP